MGHPVSPIGYRIHHRFRFIQLHAMLIKVSYLQRRPMRHVALLRFELSQHQAEQRGFSASVRSKKSDLIAAHDRGGEPVHDREIRIGKMQILDIDHLAAGPRRGLDPQVRLPHPFPPFGPLRAQRL